jgi:predicted negative regulator of RcsB-dependent stress response
MDKNTITGIVLIFLIFIGFSVYNTSRSNKAFEKTIVIADSLYKKGDFEKARTEYMNAMRFKPNQADVILKLNEINLKLGITGIVSKPDSTATKPVSSETVTENKAIPAAVTQN